MNPTWNSFVLNSYSRDYFRVLGRFRIMSEAFFNVYFLVTCSDFDLAPSAVRELRDPMHWLSVDLRIFNQILCAVSVRSDYASPLMFLQT